MKPLFVKLSLTIAIFLSSVLNGNAQPIPETYRKGTISEQLNQLESHTRIYENFRAIREDIFQLISKNILDTLASTNKRIQGLRSEIAVLNGRIDSINKVLGTTKNNLEEMTEKQGSINVLGIDINKTVYNTIMWSLLGLAVLLLVIGYIIYKKNSDRTTKAKTELSNLQKEYEDYKQKKRIELETMTMTHFNEMKKLKESVAKTAEKR